MRNSQFVIVTTEADPPDWYCQISERLNANMLHVIAVNDLFSGSDCSN